jgi:excisionase family DNA binding protein
MTTRPDLPPMLPIEKVATRWSCSTRHIRNLIARGKLRAIRPGRAWLVPVAEVEAAECRMLAGHGGSSFTAADGTPSPAAAPPVGVSLSARQIGDRPNGTSAG